MTAGDKMKNDFLFLFSRNINNNLFERVQVRMTLYYDYLLNISWCRVLDGKLIPVLENKKIINFYKYC